MSKHMTDKQMIPNDPDPSFQLNCKESYVNCSVQAAVCMEKTSSHAVITRIQDYPVPLM